MRKRLRITAPGDSLPPVILSEYEDDTRNPFEPDDKLLPAGAYVVVEVFDEKVGRFVEVLTLMVPGYQEGGNV